MHARLISQFVRVTISDPERMPLGTSGALLVRIRLGHGAAGPGGQLPCPGISALLRGLRHRPSSLAFSLAPSPFCECTRKPKATSFVGTASLAEHIFPAGHSCRSENLGISTPGMMVRMRTSGHFFRKCQSTSSDETCSPSLVPVAPSPGRGLAEPGAGQDVRHAPPRDPRGCGDL